MPALLITMSQTPTCSKQACTLSLEETSKVTADANLPFLFSVSVSDCNLSIRRAANITSAPASESSCAKQAPNPLDAPVTNARRPSNRNALATVS